MRLSIIVPAYNVEKYIVQCLDSILSCESEDFEVIVVNDGSTDGTAECVSNIHDTRLKLVTQRNGGLSAARNTGMKYAGGDYVWFVDSDDYLCDGAIGRVLEELKDADILAVNAHSIDEQENRTNVIHAYEKMDSEYADGISFFSDALAFDPKFGWYVWAFIFSRKLLNTLSLSFREGYKFEDIDYTYKAVLGAEKIAVINTPFYIYRINRAGSIATSISVKKEADLLFMASENIKNVCDMDLPAELKQMITNDFSYNYYNVLLDYRLSDDKPEIRKLLKRHKDMVNYTKIGKMRLFAFSVKTVGIEAASWLVYMNSFRRGVQR